MNIINADWTTVGFVPAEPGWRTVYREEDGKLSLYPMPGWLIQAYEPPEESKRLPPMSEREKRIVGADVDDGVLVPCDGAENFVEILSPGEEPTTLNRT